MLGPLEAGSLAANKALQCAHSIHRGISVTRRGPPHVTSTYALGVFISWTNLIKAISQQLSNAGKCSS